MSHFFSSSGQSIGVSASAPFLPVNIQGWFPLGLTRWISLQSKGLLRAFSSTTVWKHQFFGIQSSLWSNSHIHTWLLEKPQLELYRSLSAKWCLLFNTLSRFVLAVLPRSKSLLISWLQSLSAVIMEPKKMKCHCFQFFPIYLPWSDGTGCHDLPFWMLSFKPAFSLSSFTFTKRLFNSSSFSAIKVVSSEYLRLVIFLLEILILACDSSTQHFMWCTLHVS